MIKTILVDDHRLFCDGLERVLRESRQFTVIRKYNNGHAFLEDIQNLHPDLLVIDIEMPGMNGFDSIKRFRVNNRQCTIVVLSMHEETVFSQEAFMLGANGYLNKSMDSTQLIDSLLKACKGARVSTPTSSNSIIESPFSSRELEIIRLISSGKTSEQIAQRLLISPLTVKTHRRNMMRKLKVSNAAELISKALEMGYLNSLQ